jgi:hypothetical protein
MGRVLLAKFAILLKFQAIGSTGFIFCRGVIPVLASFTFQLNNNSHFSFQLSANSWQPLHYSIICVHTPAPTVRPPSRIANRISFSIATGVIKSTSIVTLSPGITISTPSGNFTFPVTSVVRK